MFLRTKNSLKAGDNFQIYIKHFVSRQFLSESKTFEVKNCNKTCFYCEYILEVSQLKSKKVAELFFPN